MTSPSKHVFLAQVVEVCRVSKKIERIAFVVTLDCTYLDLIHFTSGMTANQVKRRKRAKRDLPATTLILKTSLVAGMKRSAVDAEIGFVTPLDAKASISIVTLDDAVPIVGDTLEFSIVTEDARV